MKERLEALWRHVFRTGIVPAAEVACPRVTIDGVLTASGHVGQFTDLVVRCSKGHPSRADHLVNVDGPADALEPVALDALIGDQGVKCPTCGDAKWTKAAPLNLMFQTEIGPGSGRTGYLRPETAQGIFTDFPHLLRHFRGRLPFAALQLGGANRNEISPRQGMLRLREFHMMEAEVFFATTDAPLPGFHAAGDETATFVPAQGPHAGTSITRTFREAVDGGLIANENLAYFMATAHRFLTLAGIDNARMRFRQHEANEMAHYAVDCWDAEFLSERYGWVECVGVADRGRYDLSQHAKATGRWRDFTVRVPIKPTRVRLLEPVPSVLGKTFRAGAKAVIARIEAANIAALRDAGVAIDSSFRSVDDATGETVALDDEPGLPLPAVDVPGDCVVTKTVEIRERRVVPHVIEPSFGVDRILYALWEHAYERTTKNDDDYTRLRLSLHVAPVQVAVLPLTSDEGIVAMASAVEQSLRRVGLRVDTDAAGNIGRRYARQDEIGSPFCVTIDDASLTDKSATVRDRDTTQQIRLPLRLLAAEMLKRFALP